MNSIKLEVLVLIRRHQKITTVADLLSLKQPTVTFHMKSLEKEMGVQLFYSNPAKIMLTEAGKALSHYAAKILSLQEESRRVLEEYKQGHWGSLRIGASNVPATYVLPRIFGDFQKHYEQARISLVVKTAPLIHEMLLNHEIDAGIISASDAVSSGSVTYEALRNDELVLACLPNHPLTREQSWIPARIAEEFFILHEEDSTTRKMCEAWAANCGVQLKTRMELGSAEAIKQAIVSGVGVSILSRTAIENEMRKGDIWGKPLPGNVPQRHIYLGMNRDRIISPLIKQFVSYLKNQLPPLPQ